MNLIATQFTQVKTGLGPTNYKPQKIKSKENIIFLWFYQDVTSNLMVQINSVHT